MRALIAVGLAAGLIAAPGVQVIASTTTASAAANDPIALQLGEPREAGRGTLRFLGMRVYEALLWVPSQASAASAASERAGALSAPFDRDFALELVYAMELSGARIAERSDVEIGRSPERGTPAQRARWLERMRAIFPDVRAGDRIVGVYRVNGPSRFFLNGKPIGEVDDPAFGRAFFGVWLDAKTSEPALREALLRGLTPGATAPARASAVPVEPASR
jgi:hypothetical protein